MRLPAGRAVGMVGHERRQFAGVVERAEITLQLQQRARHAGVEPRAFRQPVLGLFPGVRREYELIERAPGREREQQPMHRRQQQYPGRRQQAAAQQAEPAEKGRREIADHHRHGVDRREDGNGRTIGVPDRGTARHRIDQRRHEQWMHQRRQRITADDELKGEKARQAQIAQQPAPAHAYAPARSASSP